MKVVLHSLEFVPIRNTEKAIQLRVIRQFKNGLPIAYDEFWIPRAQILSEDKDWLDKKYDGEYLYIIGLPEWLVRKHKLMKHVYKSASNLDIYIKNLKKRGVYDGKHIK